MSSPSRDAAARAADRLGKAVLPHLLGQLDGTTESFRALARRLSEDPDATLADEAALTGVEAAQGEAHRVGWFLGCLASASGTDLLIARREENGLRLFSSLVLEALGAETDIEPGTEALPRIATGVGRGWELSFTAGFLFYLALSGDLEERDGRRVLRWSLEHRDDQVFLRVAAALRPEDAALLEELAGLLPGARASASVEHAELRVPLKWLAPGAV